MESRRSILLAGSIALAIGFLLTLGVVSARILGERAQLVASLDRIEARLASIEVALLARQERPPPLAAAARRNDGDSIVPHAAAPDERDRSQLPQEHLELGAALRGITARLDELQVALEALQRQGRAEGIVWAGAVQDPIEKPPEDLQVRLDVRIVHEAEGLGVKVYWTLTGGEGGASDRDWIGLYPLETTNKDYVRWQSTGGLRSGEMTLKPPDKPGWYEARYLFKSGYEAVPSPSAPVAIAPVAAAEASENPQSR